MGNIKTKSNKNKILINFITAIAITAIILIIIFFATRKSALEKCADVGFIYIWGEQNKAYISKTFKEKMNFFSYRRSCNLKQNDYGRCISVVRLI